MLLNLHEFAILQYPSMNQLLHVWALLQTKIVETPPTRQVISCRHFVVCLVRMAKPMAYWLTGHAMLWWKNCGILLEAGGRSLVELAHENVLTDTCPGSKYHTASWTQKSPYSLGSYFRRGSCWRERTSEFHTDVENSPEKEIRTYKTWHQNGKYNGRLKYQTRCTGDLPAH